MPEHRAPSPRRARRRLLATLAVPAIALGGVLGATAAGGGTTPTSTAALSTTEDTAAAARPAAATSSAAAPSTSVDSAAVLAAVDAAAAAAGGTISVVALDGSGTELVASADAGTTHYTASLVKLLVVQQLLARDAAGTLTLDADDLALMERAVEASDDDAMSTLWVRFDGDELVTAAAAEFGLTGTAAPDTAGQWGESTTTAQDYATFLAGLGKHLSAADLATLVAWMQSTTGTAADGFDQDFGLLSADAGATGDVAAKQGWMCCVDATRQLHSAAVLSDGSVVVLLGEFSSGTSWAQARAALDAAAAAALSGT